MKEPLDVWMRAVLTRALRDNLRDHYAGVDYMDVSTLQITLVDLISEEDERVNVHWIAEAMVSRFMLNGSIECKLNVGIIEFEAIDDTLQDFMYLNTGSSIFIKTKELFGQQSGNIQVWGNKWKPIRAHNIEDARNKASLIEKVKP